MRTFERLPSRLIGLTVVATLAFGSVAVAQDDEAAPVDDAVTPVEASIVDFSFQPAAVEVAAGTSVTWINEDGVPHTVTAVNGEFDSGVIEPGSSFDQVFAEPGTFDYVCSIHPSMTGTVVVAEVAADAGDAGDEPTDDAVAVAVDVVDFSFDPAEIAIQVGETVEWTNVDPAAHTVTASDGSFDSGSLASGDTFQQTFDEPGTFDFFCAIHPSMTGTVTVSE